jgi:hypothetical protein
MLAQAVRSVGAERFARFWRSTSAPDSAFLVAAGIGIEPWTQRWLTQVYGPPPAPPSVRLADVVWLCIAAAAALAVAARPRQRVLA